MSEERERPVFKRDLLIVAEDGNLYHLTEAEYKAHPVDVKAGCEARKMIARGMTLGALIPDDLGSVDSAAERACCGVCFVVNLSALQHFNDGAMNPDNRRQVSPPRDTKPGGDEG
jgi:hypothetical protein